MDKRRPNLSDHKELDFKLIYSQFQPKILRFTSNMIGETEAEDLTQEIFIKVNSALPNFRGESKLSTWIYRIATNAVVDRLRSSDFKQEARKSASSCITEGAEAELDDRNIWTGETIPMPEIQVVREEMSACVQEYLHKLPENYRLVLGLSEFANLSSQEIADILGITVAAAKIRLHRARQRLKKDLIATCPPYWVEGNEYLPDLKDL